MTYEKAVDRYTDSGFPNNAIALCNKILRNAPGRTPVYLKLAKLMVERGFVAEAKRNLLEYAERMQKAGQLEDAFRALKEFADLSPDNEEIRLLLAEQLKAAARTDEAREQLSKLYAEVESTGDERRTRSTLQKMKAIDPEYDVEAAPKPKLRRKEKTSELVFLDLDEPVTAQMASEPAVIEDVELVETVSDEIEDLAVEEIEVAESIAFEPTSFEEETAAAVEEEIPEATLEIEPTSFEEETQKVRAEGFEIQRASADYLAIDDSEVETIDGLAVEEEFEAPAEEEVASLEFEPTAVEERPEAMIDEVIEEVEAVEEEEESAAGEDLVPQVEGSPALGEVGAIEVPELDLVRFDLETPPEAAAGTEPPAVEEDEEAIEVLEGDVEDEEVEEEIAAVLDSAFAAAAAVAVPESVEAPPPPDLAQLEILLADDPDNAELHCSLAETLLEAGDRERALEEFDIALKIEEQAQEWDQADRVVGEILRVDPNSVRHHQKRVELAFQQGSKRALADAYLGLADALLRGDEPARARAVYHRVLEHDQTNERALLALSSLEPPEEAAPEPAAVAARPGPTEKGDFIDLGAFILEDEPLVKDTRMRIEEEEPTGDEQRDFEEMLSEFKRGIEANLADEDWQAHYDLGVAFKEMGLLDEAIGEFQKALRAPEGRLKTAEALGVCFFEKGQHSVGATVLRRAVDSDSGGDESKIGLLYWLARCEETQGKKDEALSHYQRVFAIDINFQDVDERVRELGG